MFRNQLNNKIGNLLSYLSTQIPNLSMTKALKLLYLIDETSYMQTGVSVTWLDYKVWEMGPVAEELYNELRYDQSHLQKWRSPLKHWKSLLKPKKWMDSAARHK